jgi:hypothetical protein
VDGSASLAGVRETGSGTSRGVSVATPGNNAQGGSDLPPNDPTFPLVVTSLDIAQKDKVFFLNCFNDRIYTYTFGHDVGDINITFMGFLSSGVKFNQNGAAGKGGQETAIISAFLAAYSIGRVSNSGRFATISIGTKGELTGLITGMSSKTANTETNIQSFTLSLKTVSVQGAGFRGNAPAAGKDVPQERARTSKEKLDASRQQSLTTASTPEQPTTTNAAPSSAFSGSVESTQDSIRNTKQNRYLDTLFDRGSDSTNRFGGITGAEADRLIEAGYATTRDTFNVIDGT